MKKIEIKFQYNGTKYNKEAVINDDINDKEVLAKHSKNKNVNAEWGMAKELGIWSLNFTEPYMEIECDFRAKNILGGFEQLSLEPVEVLIWTKNGTCINTDTIPFEANISNL